MSDHTQPAHVRLAELAQQIRYTNMEREVIEGCKLILLDSIACIAGGLASTPSAAAQSLAEEFGGPGTARVLGISKSVSVPMAVFANGTALRYMDFNDYYFGRDPIHPSGSIPVALAIAEHLHLDGPTLLTAIAAAYELHIRLCDATGAPSLRARGWHHASLLPFPAACIAGLMLTGDVRVAAHAMAIAATHGGTLAQFQHGAIPTMKATAEAWAAKAAVEAAFLAWAGVTGPADIIGGSAGWGSCIAGAVDYDALLAPVARLRVLDVCLKPYPVVAPATAVVHAAITIHNLPDFIPDDVEAVSVGVPEYVIAHNGDDPEKRFPSDRETADHSYHYCAAVGLLDGACGGAQFDEARIRAADIRRILERTRLEPVPEFTSRWPTAAGGRVTVQMRDGRTLEVGFDYQIGHPKNPMGRSAVVAKLAEFCGGAAAARIEQAVDNLETCGDVADFARTVDAALAGEPRKEEN